MATGRTHFEDGEDWDNYREFLLEQIDDWESGQKATAGQPANGNNYGRSAREETKRLESQLQKMGGYGSDRSGRPNR